MKFNHLGGVALIALMSLASCGAPKFMASYAPEESGLNLMKITDETANTVAGNRSNNYFVPTDGMGGCSSAKFSWSTGRLLDVSPDGSELAYVSIMNNQWNVMVRKSGPQGTATQRTFRSVNDFSWGVDDNLYFGDAVDGSRIQISSTNAHVGSIMRQLTNNNTDLNPILSADGKKLYFTRVEGLAHSYGLMT